MFLLINWSYCWLGKREHINWKLSGIHSTFLNKTWCSRYTISQCKNAILKGSHEIDTFESNHISNTCLIYFTISIKFFFPWPRHWKLIVFTGNQGWNVISFHLNCFYSKLWALASCLICFPFHPFVHSTAIFKSV